MAQHTINIQDIERFMIGHGFVRSENDYLIFLTKDGRFSVVIDSEYGAEVYDLSESEDQIPITDSLQTVDQLRDELVSLGAIEWECPYCGEEGGEPVTCTWQEFQGCEEHGGVVTFEEEMCSKCYKPQRNLLVVPR